MHILPCDPDPDPRLECDPVQEHLDLVSEIHSLLAAGVDVRKRSQFHVAQVQTGVLQSGNILSYWYK